MIFILLCILPYSILFYRGARIETRLLFVIAVEVIIMFVLNYISESSFKIIGWLPFFYEMFFFLSVLLNIIIIAAIMIFKRK
jgi:hypothetical protein